MESRKIQSTAGGATYIVSLPKPWVKSNRLKSGDSVGVIPQEKGMLFILPNPGREKKKIVHIDAQGKDTHFLSRLIISEYIRGADVIRFRSANFTWKEKKAIRGFIQEAMLGLDLDEHAGAFEIISRMEISSLDTEKIIMRLYDLIHWMFTHSMVAIESGDTALLADIISRDLEVDRLTLLASRQMHLAASNPVFAEKMGITSYDTLYYKLLSEDLESAGDCSVSIAHASVHLISKKIPSDIKSGLKSLFDTQSKNLEYVIESLSSVDVTLANSVVEDCMKMEKESFSAISKSRFITDNRITGDPETVGSIAIILENLARTNSIIRSIAEIVIDHPATEAGE